MLDFRLLGPLEVVGDAGPVPLGAPKQRALLAFLLLHVGEAVSSARLIDVLWGEHPPKTAASSLQNFIVQLRKLVGAGVVETTPFGYRLLVDATQVDAKRFELLVAEARRSTDPERRSGTLAEALSLFRGEPLADFALEEFATQEVRRLEELRLSALEDRIDAELELGRHAEVVTDLERLVAAEPFRERARGQLMLALYRSGRQADALAAYQDARRALVEELGIDPSPELQRLHASILRQDARLASRAAGADEDHLDAVVRVLLAGRIVPVVGAGATGGEGEAPTPTAAAERLAASFGYGESVLELPRVSQYIATLTGPGPLYDELHALYSADYQPARVHRFLASLPPVLRERGSPHQLIVSTGYDLALEQAFLEAGEQFDVVAYLASGRHRGKFAHVIPGGTASVIDVPNMYATELSLDRRTVILKLHGQAERTETREWESFVVTEDDYIAYLAQSDIAGVVPVSLVAKLRRSHFLFLGYALRDWNLRVVLNRLWGDEQIAYRSWAVQPSATQLEHAFWRQRDVELIESPLDEYVHVLAQRLRAHAGVESPA